MYFPDSGETRDDATEVICRTPSLNAMRAARAACETLWFGTHEHSVEHAVGKAHGLDGLV